LHLLLLLLDVLEVKVTYSSCEISHTGPC